MKYLITGGAGFIGSNFIYYLLDKYGDDIQVLNIDKLTYAGHLENLKQIDKQFRTNGNYIFKQLDIADADEIREAFEHFRPDIVVNFAAESHVDRSLITPELFVRTNVVGTQILLQYALEFGVTRFHQVSTDEVYGSIDEGFFTETSPLNPRSPYSASKASADLLCLAYYESFSMPVTISRCSNNFGPYQYPEKLIPLMIMKALKGESLPIYGDGSNVRDWLHVEDHCTAIDLIINNGKTGHVYNVGSHNEWTNLDLTRLLLQTINEQLPDSDTRKKDITPDLIEFVEDRKGHDKRYAIDSSKIKNELGWLPSHNFNEALSKTINWYLENMNWVKTVTAK